MVHALDRDAYGTCGAVCSDERNNGVIRVVSNSVFSANGGQYCDAGGAIDSESVPELFAVNREVIKACSSFYGC